MTEPTQGAALLREAAAKLRELVNAVARSQGTVPGEGWYENDEMLSRLDTEEDADFTASMTPAVALAVADWLETVADLTDPPSRLSMGAPPAADVLLWSDAHPYTVKGRALAVARTFLGRES